MHGYFMNIRLYNQAKSVAEPFAFAEYRKKKLHEKIYLKRVKSRVPMPIASIVNKDLAEKLQQNKSELNIKNKKKQKSLENKETPSILIDTRFQSLFTNLDMQIDANHKYFKSIAPLVSRLNKQTAVEDESISNENEEEEREDNLIDDILTSEEEKETTHRKTKLVPLDAINDTLIKKLFVHYFLSTNILNISSDLHILHLHMAANNMLTDRQVRKFDEDTTVALEHDSSYLQKMMSDEENKGPVLHGYLKEHLTSNWNIYDDDQELIDLFWKWKQILEDETIDVTIDNSIQSTENMNPYHRLVWDVWMPFLRKSIREWNPREPDDLIDFIERWIPYLP
ncbi:unnamed protein product [Rotaria socialis]|uniref:GCF C-terminal domain-containing protein n=2 Tax=Rotaria TaxID=231623 RepID=A0A818N9G5_9BILA|nr:unnamed protein product [Rotaria socialis]